MTFLKAVIFAVFLAIISNAARAQDVPRPYVHIVREGDTLASIAERYYGDARREKVLVMDNGLHIDGGSPIMQGMRLNIPTVTYHRVTQGETWTSIAVHYYGTGRRAQAIINANPNVRGAVDPGAVVVIPYPLRHLSDQAEDLSEVARHYYGDPAMAPALHQFNNLRGSRLERGQIVLVPLRDLTLSAEGRRLLGASEGENAAHEARDVQSRIDVRLPEIHEENRQGHYLEALGIAQQVLGTGALTRRQEIAVQSELAVAYVALDRRDLAIACFRRALELDASFSLDPRQTSPRILDALNAAKTPSDAPAQGGR